MQALDLTAGITRYSHPGHMAAIGTLFGLTPPAVETARVLELNCGAGLNLIAMSQSTPAARFTGVDTDLEQARQHVAAVGAPNIELLPAVPEGTFDYVIVNGANPATALPLIAGHLSENGLAFAGYATLPGWRLRSLVGESLRFLGGSDATGARAALQSLTTTLASHNSPYARALCAEWQALQALPDHRLFDEHMRQGNEPLYFEQFAALAATQNLHFVAESRLIANSFFQPGPLVKQIDEAAGTDLLRREQYLDWLIGRYYRQSILSRATPSPHPDQDAILRLRIAPLATIVCQTPAGHRVRLQDGSEFELLDPNFSAVLQMLHATGERPVPAAALEAPILSAMEASGLDGHLQYPHLAGPIVASLLWSGCADALWTLRADSPSMAGAIPDRPTGCRLARRQAAAGPECTNRLHRLVRLDDAERQILPMLDGTQDALSLAGSLGRDEAAVRQSLALLHSLALLSPPL
jgi:hypothetical protein